MKQSVTPAKIANNGHVIVQYSSAYRAHPCNSIMATSSAAMIFIEVRYFAR